MSEIDAVKTSAATAANASPACGRIKLARPISEDIVAVERTSEDLLFVYQLIESRDHDCLSHTPCYKTACWLGAGDGNRTHVFSLEGCCSTIELHPHYPQFNFLDDQIQVHRRG